MRPALCLVVSVLLLLALVNCKGNNRPADGGAVRQPPILETTVMPPDSTGTPVTAVPTPPKGGSPAPSFKISSVSMVSQLTGAKSPASTVQHWNVVGTDLGFSFQYQGETRVVFGDTWGVDGVEGKDWRSNTMGTVKPDSAHGYVLSNMVTGKNGQAKELLSSLKDPGKEYTVTPTAGISVGSRMYLYYMSVRDWQPTTWHYKQPLPNGAGFAYSDDGGQTWTKDSNSWQPGDTPFTQAALVRDGDYIYMFGTPAGRFGPARLMRTRPESLLDPSKYEYWNGHDWTPDANAAAVVIPAPVGELSVRWNSYLHRWVTMYLDDVQHNIVMRTAPALTGPWDKERVVVTAAQYKTLYAPFMLPDVSGPEVYFTMSIFKPNYNVFLMKMNLDKSSGENSQQ